MSERIDEKPPATEIELTDLVVIADPITGAMEKATGQQIVDLINNSNNSFIADVTYAALVALITGSTLSPGRRYRITDFATRHYLMKPDGFLQDLTVTFTGNTEPLIVMAISINKIDKVAVSTVYPNDIIYYDWDSSHWTHDPGFFDITTTNDVTPTVIPNFKGVIHFRHDTINDNYCGYDFRNVKNRRYKPNVAAWSGATTYSVNQFATLGTGTSRIIYQSRTNSNTNNNPASSTANWLTYFLLDNTDYILAKKISWLDLPTDDASFADFLLFSPNALSTYDVQFKNNHISPSRDDYKYNFQYGSILLNNVFFGAPYNWRSFWFNTIGPSSHGNTITGSTNNNAIVGGLFMQNLLHSFGANKVDTYCYENVVTFDFNFNILGNSFSSKRIHCKDYCAANDFSNGSPTSFPLTDCNNFVFQNGYGGDFSTSTIAAGDYTKTVFQNSAGVVKVSYYNASDVLTIVLPSD